MSTNGDSPKGPKPIEYYQPGENKIIDGIDKTKETATNVKNKVKDTVTKPFNKKDGRKNNEYVLHGSRPKSESFLKAKGAKNKAKYTAQKAHSGIKKAGKAVSKSQTVRNMIKKVQKVAKVITTVYHTFLIPILIIVLLFNSAIFVYSILDATGSSPHYYCDIDPEPGIKQSALYKQYCGKGGGVHLELEELQGHYIWQTDTGPCTSCALLNMYMRYFASNDVDFFAYMPNSEGEYEKMVDDSTYGSIELVWAVMVKGGGDGSYSNGSCTMAIDWYNQHGKPNAHFGTIGYLCNDEVYADASTPISEMAEDMVFDKELGYGDATTYCCRGWSTGNFITLDGVTGTIEAISNPSIPKLLEVLTTHPSGVECFIDYGGSEHHAILVTGYDISTGEFYIVDSCNGAANGYEVLGTTLAWADCYNALKAGSIDYMCYIQEDGK